MKVMQTTAWSRFTSRCFTATLAVGVVSVALLYAASFWTVLNCPFSINYESITFWAALQLARGQNMYDPSALHGQPWIVNVYPPLMPMLGQFFAGNATELLLGLRVISMISAAVTFAAMWTLLRRMGCSRGGVCSALIFFCSVVPVWYTSFVGKPDYLCLAMSILSLFLFWREWSATGEKRWFIPSSVCAVLSVMAKQQGMAAPAAIFLFLLLQKRWADAARFGALTGGLLVACVLVAQLTTGGMLTYYAFLHRMHFDVENAMLVLSTFGFDAVKVFCVAIAALIYFIRGNKIDRPLQLALIFLVVSSAQAVASLAVPGAMSNHFITPLAALTMAAAFFTSRSRWLAAILVVVSIVLAPSEFDFITAQTNTVKTAGNAMLATLPHGKKLLSEDAFWNYYANDEPGMVNPINFECVWKWNKSEEQPLLEQVRSKQYAAILINHGDTIYPGSHLWNPDVVAAIKENYKRVGSGTGHGIEQDIYLPK